MIHLIVSAFCQAEQLDKSVWRYLHAHRRFDTRRYIVNGHYPLNYAANQEAYKAIASKNNYTLLDPGEDIGSAQSQNWAIEQINPALDDYILTVDPDSACDVVGWDRAMAKVMDADPSIALVHLLNPVVWERIRFLELPVQRRVVAAHKLAIPMREEQFNMTMWRVSALNAVGGILQEHPLYGQVESPMWRAIRARGWYNAYLTEFIEAYDLKSYEDQAFIDWKMAHAHHEKFSVPHFTGSFAEYCAMQKFT